MPTQQFPFSAISWREQVNFQWDDVFIVLKWVTMKKEKNMDKRQGFFNYHKININCIVFYDMHYEL